jgi:hypothetical protein
VFIVVVVYFVMTQSGNFWVHPRKHFIIWLNVVNTLQRLVTGWTIGVRGFDSRRGLGIFLFSSTSRPALGPPSLLSNGYRGLLPPGVKRPGREADHSHPSNAEVKNAWHCTSTPSTSCLIKHRDNFTTFEYH